MNLEKNQMYGIINDKHQSETINIIQHFRMLDSLEVTDVGVDGGQIHHRQTLLAARSSNA